MRLSFVSVSLSFENLCPFDCSPEHSYSEARATKLPNHIYHSYNLEVDLSDLLDFSATELPDQHFSSTLFHCDL